ncbi:DUF2147 domain-containing protein [Lichenicoccus roseus]|uniref:DUF2147 domain-containing protein n=1 Tax=Lichenicoccus roseus TaxID=2683649 RepID=UPI001F0EB1AD|nr:DUF2147 domain-containing protein [Lichenicoccus roseus]
MPTARRGRVATAIRVAILATCLAMPAPAIRAQAVAPPPPAPIGLWLSQDHDGVFDIESCGPVLCGRLVGIRYDGKMPTDNHGRPQCDLMMLTDFRPQADDPGRWAGIILDPETGRRYHAAIWSPSPGMLNLRGYLLLPIFGETQRWSRYAGSIGPACHMR